MSRSVAIDSGALRYIRAEVRRSGMLAAWDTCRVREAWRPGVITVREVLTILIP